MSRPTASLVASDGGTAGDTGGSTGADAGTATGSDEPQAVVSCRYTEICI